MSSNFSNKRKVAILAALALLVAIATADINSVSGPLPTYTCGVSNITAATTPTDIVTVTPGAGQVVRIVKELVYGTQTTGAPVTFQIIRRSTADSGGTAVQDGVNPLDTADGATTTTCFHYTANPASLGTANGTLLNARPMIPTAASFPTGTDFQAWGDGTEPITLRGVNDSASINLGAQTVTGLAYTVQFYFTISTN